MNDDVERLVVERACERLVLDSAAYNDHRDWTALAALYTPDARLVRPSGQVVHGRDAIEASYRHGPPERRTRHVCTNIRVDVADDVTATGTTLVLLYSWTEPADGSDAPAAIGPPGVGEFADIFVRAAYGWRIRDRTARLLGRPTAT